MSTAAALLFQPDSTTRGAHLYNVTARIQDDRLRFTGSFDAAELLPVLLFSVGVPWIKPCVDSVCCVWEAAVRYKDDDLLRAIGGKCDRGMNLTEKELMKGSEVALVSAASTIKQWDLVTRIHPNYVIMLFVCLAPMFYMYYEVVPIQWVERNSITWSASWYGEQCHTVAYPDGREVCIHCANSKPAHSAYVFSADWFQTFECRWVCEAGYTGLNCEVAVYTALYACGGAFIVLCIAGVVLATLNRHSLVFHRSGKAAPVVLSKEEIGPSPDEERAGNVAQTPAPARLRSEMIAFKDNAVGEIRIKFL